MITPAKPINITLRSITFALALALLALVALSACASHPTPTLDAQKEGVRRSLYSPATRQGGEIPAEGPNSQERETWELQ